MTATANTETAAERPRERRSSGEVHRLILEAAQEMFASQGYGATSLRAIADRARVAPSMVTRGFGSKANLFDRAIGEPFREVLADYAVRYEHPTDGRWDFDRIAREYIEGLYGFLTTHRQLGRALVSAYLFETEAAEQVDSPFTDVLSRVEGIGTAAMRDAGLSGVEVPINIRAVFGMVMSMALLPDLFFPPGHRRPARSRIVEEMVGLMMHGNLHRSQ